jgi:hypothetical protein
MLYKEEKDNAKERETPQMNANIFVSVPAAYCTREIG